MFKKLLKFVFLAAVVLVVWRLTPQSTRQNLKDKTFAAVSKLLPENLKDEAGRFIYTPSERRMRLLGQLEKNIAAIKKEMEERLEGSAGLKNQGTEKESQTKTSAVQNTGRVGDVFSEEVIEKLEEAEKIIKEIEENNTDQTVINKITTGVFNKLNPKEPTGIDDCVCEKSAN